MREARGQGRAPRVARTEAPAPFRAPGAVAFATLLLRQAEVAVASGRGFGEYGEEWVRLGLVENEQRIRQAARAVRRLLADPGTALARHAEAEARAEG